MSFYQPDPTNAPESTLYEQYARFKLNGWETADFYMTSWWVNSPERVIFSIALCVWEHITFHHRLMKIWQISSEATSWEAYSKGDIALIREKIDETQRIIDTLLRTDTPITSIIPNEENLWVNYIGNR